MESKKVLIIDDEVTLQKTLSEVLTQDGFNVSAALDGEKGVAVAKNIAPDIILLDIIMPRMNGFKVLEEIKGNNKTKNVPVLVLTNLDGEKEAKKMIDLGAKDYLIKASHSLGDIVKRIKDILE